MRKVKIIMGLIMVSIYIISGSLLLKYRISDSITESTHIILGSVLILYGIYRAIRLLLSKKDNDQTL